MSAAEPLEADDGHRRTGRRDRALAEWRKARAVELRIEGCGYDDIAREVGYANRGTAYKAVQKALSTRTADGVDQLRSMEVARLNALQFAVWDRAMAGHVPSIRAVLKIIVARIALLGLAVADLDSDGCRVAFPGLPYKTGTPGPQRPAEASHLGDRAARERSQMCCAARSRTARRRRPGR